MSRTITQIRQQSEWERAERRDGYQAGLFGAKAGRANEHFQRGWREGRAARQRVRIKQESRFVSETEVPEQFHTAYLKGRVVGRWQIGSDSNWAFDEHGLSMSNYNDWKRALQEGHRGD